MLLAVFLILGCTERSKNQENCLKSLIYRSRRFELIPDLIKINIANDGQRVSEKLSLHNFADEVLFYSLPQDDREYFIAGSIISTKDSITLQVSTSFFHSERGRKVWTSKEVENLLLKDSIGIIVGKDTLVVNRCK